MSATDSNDSSALLTPNSEYEAPFSWRRSSSINSQDPRHPRFPDLEGRRGSAAGQHDLVIQAQKGLGPTVSQGQQYPSSRKAHAVYDLQTQARYGLGPTVSYKEPATERRGSSVQHDLLSQAVYGHGMTVPVSQPVQEGPKRTADYDLSTQAEKVRGVNMRNPYGAKKNFDSYDLSSQYRKFL